MLKEIFVKEYYPMAKAAGEKFGINPVVILAQCAIESGWASSNLTKLGNNLFGICAYGRSNNNPYWTGDKIRLNEGGLSFRRYNNREDSFMDFGRLIQTGYPNAAGVSHYVSAYAQEIAYSRYISEVNGDNRMQYKKLIIQIAASIQKILTLREAE